MPACPVCRYMLWPLPFPNAIAILIFRSLSICLSPTARGAAEYSCRFHMDFQYSAQRKAAVFSQCAAGNWGKGEKMLILPRIFAIYIYIFFFRGVNYSDGTGSYWTLDIFFVDMHITIGVFIIFLNYSIHYGIKRFKIAAVDDREFSWMFLYLRDHSRPKPVV